MLFYVENALPIMYTLLGILTACGAFLIFARNVRSVRAEVTAANNGSDNTRTEELARRVSELAAALQQVQARPDIGQYREVLLRLEKVEGSTRVLTDRMEETVESLQRTRNKIIARAARAERPRKPDPEPDPDDAEPLLPLPVLPPPHANGAQPVNGIRRFGKLT